LGLLALCQLTLFSGRDSLSSTDVMLSCGDTTTK
jgi:hypothetical protein